MYSIKPGRGPSCAGAVGGLVMAAFGTLWTILAAAITHDSPIPVVGWVFPAFGVLFVCVGLGSAAYSLYNARARERFSVMDITRAEDEPDPLAPREHARRSPGPGGVRVKDSLESRLQRLDELRTRGLITDEEHAEQRRRLLDTL